MLAQTILSIIGITVKGKIFHCATSLNLKFISVKHVFLDLPFGEIEGHRRTLCE